MKQHKSMSILRRMTVPLFLLVIMQYLLLGGSLVASGVFDKLGTNAVEMLNQKLSNRTVYLNGEIKQRVEIANETASSVNMRVGQLLADGTVTHDSLGDNDGTDSTVLSAVSEEVITMLRESCASGAFVFLFTGNLNAQTEPNTQIKLSGFYLRDPDPKGSPLSSNSDIVLEYAPESIVDASGIRKSNFWQSDYALNVDENGHAEYIPFLYEPYDAAFTYSMNPSELGYWSMPCIASDGCEIIAYSMPLVLDDGTCYGVIGMDFTTEYLRGVIPGDELLSEGKSSYLIAAADNYSNIFVNVSANGDIDAYSSESLSKEKYTIIEDGVNELHSIQNKGNGTLVAAMEHLTMYGNTTPYSDNTWVLFAIVEKHALFSFTDSVVITLVLAASFSLLIGIAVIFVVSYGITTPIHLISQKLRESDTRHIVVLDKINITEIDELSSAVQHLSEDLFSSATKFSRIVKMASVNIAAYEISRDNNSLYITDNFFKVFARPVLDNSVLTVDEFNERMESFNEYVVERNDTNTNILYKIPFDGERRYIQLKIMYENDRILGLAEDITLDTIEKQKIVYERDYDLLTGLLNRRAFKRSIDLACREPEKLYTGFMMMMDLDNLKYINDTYGHDYGDDYIRAAADCLKTALAEYDSSAIISRISGDEFFVFAYGFGGKADARKAIAAVKDAIAKKDIKIPNGKEYKLRASGGISWYPSDSTSISQLMKYADFAMYKIKLTTKGKFNEFDRAVYERESFLLHSKGEFNRLIDENCVIYHFQPIVNVRTGAIFAYEALMRSLLPTLKSPYEIITLARAESKLEQIERLTFVNALSTYANHVEGGAIADGCKLFINSLTDRVIASDDIELIEKQYSSLLGSVVVEFPDESRCNEDILSEKLALFGKWNAQIAIDDYEAEKEKSLINKINPAYIKIDIAVVRDIDKDFEKQRLAVKIVANAHEYGIEVIAEGVETRAELEKLVDIGIDYAQGYLAARPAAEPPEVSREFLSIIGA